MKSKNKNLELYFTTTHRTEAIATMLGLVDLVNNKDLEKINKPFLVIYSEFDKVVSPEKVKNAFQRIGSKQKQIIQFNESQDPFHHILAGDLFSPSSTNKVANMIFEFIKTIDLKTSLYKKYTLNGLKCYVWLCAAFGQL